MAWHMAMDEGANIQSVFLDLSKAYDRVSISGLLSKLSSIGFDYPSLEWFANRSTAQTTMCTLAEHYIYLADVPQGTVLGPVLFLIFINDLSELIQNQASFFADGTTLHATDKSLVSSCVSLSGDLDRAANWADGWGMLFGAPKSKHLPIGRETQQSPSVFMKGVPIPQVQTHKHLGLIFNITRTWNDHISNRYTTHGARMTAILRRLDGSIPSSSMKKNYTAVIHPRIEYACAVWSGGPTQRLQRLQDSLSKRHGIMLPPLLKRFDYHTLVLLYRIREKFLPNHLSLLLPLPHIEHIWLFAEKALLSCPFYKKICHSQ